jgi:transcriptional regulator with XRE-family HTH domain
VAEGLTVLDDVPLEPQALYLRGYVVRDKKTPGGAFDPEAEEVDRVPPSEWTLTFDCETSTDAAQALRFGAYQVRENGDLVEEGLFYAEEIEATDLAVLKEVAKAEGLRLRTVRHFVNYVLFDQIYRLGGIVIGFNLPFDISRVALDHGSARRSMSGGFSFKLSKNTDWPRVRVKHISAKMAFIRYGAPPTKRTPAGQKKRGLVVPVRRGSFVDVKTLASALLSGSYSLLTLSRDVLKVEHPKLETDEHGGALTRDYVAYGRQDVQATWECYVALTERFNSYGLTTVEPKTLYSEASLGKAYLKQMGVKPWQDLQPDFPPEMIGQILSTYYGGRAEVNIRREKRQVLYCDFLSMYPTVCTLMGLWRFVIANGVAWRDATAQTQAFLDDLEPADMMECAAWSRLTTLVQLRPEDDILPVRARYAGDQSCNIGVNRLTSETPLWYTLADVIASKVLRGKAPVILAAIQFAPDGMQNELAPINIMGDPKFRVEPATTDFYRRVIDLRQSVKAMRDKASGAERARLDGEQLALKILANATSYGIFIEMIVNDLEKAEVLKAYGVDGREFPVTTKKFEQPGYFFHPLLATLITGAARLMLALAERRAKDEGLNWVFCDTDSIAMAKPDDMDRRSFIAAAGRVCDAFKGLNPYEAANGSILQVEDQNYATEGAADLDTAPPLYCYAVSAKRYALFNMEAGAPIIRKASAHGLGHLLPPYHDPDEKSRADRLHQIKVDLWQEDLWKRIINAAENPDETEAGAVIGLDIDPKLAKPAASRYAATTPALLKWFEHYNRGRPYERKVRPFGFLLSLQAERMEQIADGDREALAWWRKYRRDPAPTAPFDRDPGEAAKRAFDRRRRQLSVPERWLITYADALKDYHLQPEPKFFGGEVRRAGGPLRRRHVKAGVTWHIGKEADRWEEQLYIGEDDGEIDYGLAPDARAKCVANIKEARKRFVVRRFTTAAQCSDKTIAAATSGLNLVSDAKLVHLSDVAIKLLNRMEEQSTEEAALLEWAYEQWLVVGKSKFAQRLGVDQSNLSKVFLNKRRSPSRDLFERIAAAKAENEAAANAQDDGANTLVR